LEDERKAEEAKLIPQQKKKKWQRREESKSKEPIDDVRNYDLPPHFGSVFVEFLSTEDAVAAKKGLLNLMSSNSEGGDIGKEGALKYDGRLIETYFWDEEEYENFDFG
jgi:hypothetical protein